MGIRKTIAAVITAAMVLSMTACTNNEKPNNEGGVTNSNSSSTNKVFGIEDAVPEPPKQVSMWDVLPEIPVTDASAFKYKYDSGLEGMVITDYLKESPKVRIPSTLEGEPVVGIEWGRNDQKYTITELIFPDTMKEINIERVKGLKYMNFPYIFSLESNSGLSFLYTTRKPTLSIAYIDEGVNTIGNSFQDCEELTTISIPNSITAISASAFDGCPNLAEVYYKGKKYDGLTEELIDTINSNSNGGFIVEDGVLEEIYGSGDLVIPKNVTTINSDTKFLNQTSISSITIPDSVTSIGDGAFKDYTDLTSVTIGNGVTEIGLQAFYGCTGLTSVTIPDSVTEFGSSAFEGCTGLTSVTIGNGVTYIGNMAFKGCKGLTSVTIGNGVTTIGSEAFSGCTGLTSVTIPDSVTLIWDGVFSGCTGLTSINVSDGNTKYFDIDGILYEKNNYHTLIKYPQGRTGSITIPDSVTEIGNSAFEGCTGLTSVTIPDSVTWIGGSAFSGCKGLTSVTYKGKTYDYEQIHDLYDTING